jgi:hypothetical protein
MTCIYHYETSPPPPLVIPIASILLHPVILIEFNLSLHFTSCLPHQPRVIPQSSILTLGAYPSHKQRSCVPSPNCGCLYALEEMLSILTIFLQLLCD